MAVTLVAATSFVNASYDNQAYDPSGCCPCGPVRPCVDPCGNWFFEADYLYWKACGDCDSDFGFDGSFNTNRDNCNGRWSSGFRLSLGYDLPCDGWDITTYWTHLENSNGNGHHRRHSSSSSSSSSSFDGSSSSSSFGGNHRSRKFYYDVFDAELGREFCCSPCVTLRPFVGIRAAWIEQKFKRNSFFSSEEFGFNENFKSNFDGVGLRTGLNTEWKLGWCGLSLYGDAAASVLVGKHHRSFHFGNSSSSSDEFAGSSDSSSNRFKTSHDGCRGVLDGAIGLRWKEYFSCDTIALTLSIGYENHLYFGSRHDELCLHGLTVGGKVAF